jgi:hypothetical protein
VPVQANGLKRRALIVCIDEGIIFNLIRLFSRKLH